MLSIYWKVRRYIARPSQREQSLAQALAGALDAISRLSHHGDEDAREEALEKLLRAKDFFSDYLEAAYPQPGPTRKQLRRAKEQAKENENLVAW